MVTTKFGQYQWILSGLAKNDEIAERTRSMITEARGRVVKIQKEKKN